MRAGGLRAMTPAPSAEHLSQSGRCRQPLPAVYPSSNSSRRVQRAGGCSRWWTTALRRSCCSAWAACRGGHLMSQGPPYARVIIGPSMLQQSSISAHSSQLESFPPLSSLVTALFCMPRRWDSVVSRRKQKGSESSLPVHTGCSPKW